MKNYPVKSLTGLFVALILLMVASGFLPGHISVNNAVSFALGASQSKPAPHAQTGQRGIADQRAVIHLTKIAKSAPAAQNSGKTPEIIAFNYLPDQDVPSADTIIDKPAQRSPISPSESSPAPAASFLALEDDITRIPPDTHGSAGLSHLMVTLNSQIRIQNKSGAIINAMTLNNFWENVNGGAGAFDPRVLYDPYSNRWMVVSADDAQSSTSGLLVAVSQTSDPTGSWYQYRIQSTDTNWIDYPNIGFNQKWIVVTANLFTSSGNFVRREIYAFDKNNLYAGGGGIYTVFTDTSGGGSWSPAETFDSNLDVLYLLQTYSSASGSLRMAVISGPVGAETLSTDTSGGFNINYGSGWSGSPPNGDDFAPQLGSTKKIQTNDHRVQNVVYRNGSLWTAHTIFLPSGGSPTVSAVQWWQIDPNTPPGNPPGLTQKGRIEDPNGLVFYAFPSIAVNQNNDALIGFSRYSANQYASGNYAFRSSSDPANTFRSDVVLKAGEAPYYKTYSGTRNRWGDYSHSSVDPVNDIDFWTIQEYAWTNNGQYDRWGTWWGKVLPPGMPGTATPTATATLTPTPTQTATVTPTPTSTPTPTLLVIQDPVYLPIIRRN